MDSFAISPLDGRYGKRLQHLGLYFSEYALMRMRVVVELRYLKALDKTGLFEKLGADELAAIDKIIESFSEEDYDKIKEIESRLNHDVKSCEVYLRENLPLKNKNMIHFALTSEDVNNLSYSLMLSDYWQKEQLPQLKDLLTRLVEMSKEWKDIPFPARTHGQMASPTTAGKEFSVYLYRLYEQYEKLKNFRFKGKLNGATGTFSAMLSAFPDYDWITFSKEFITDLGLEPNLVTTQIESHDSWLDYFAIVRHINTILLDMNRDIWLYLTLGYLTLAADKGAVGSSTMPHKVNPINFENSEGNLQTANALLNAFEEKLGQSRLQRDLSDSTVTRNIGVALAHSYLAVQESLKGMNRLAVNEGYCKKELENYPELLAEPIQTILRREGFDDPYNLMKELTRGKKIEPQELEAFIDNLDVNDSVKTELKSLTVVGYIGNAPQICEMVLKEVKL